VNEPIPDETLAPAAQTVLKRNMPLIPSGSIAGNALVVVIAIMTFLACLTAAGLSSSLAPRKAGDPRFFGTSRSS